MLLYEMLTGQSPFSGCDEDELFWSICNERPFIPRYLSQDSSDILVALLEKDSGKRLPGHEIALHSFFHVINLVESIYGLVSIHEHRRRPFCVIETFHLNCEIHKTINMFISSAIAMG